MSQLLERAFVHRSYLNEHPEEEKESNERLEFLGDAVLEFITSEYLYQTYPEQPEGRLTAYRSSLVKTSSLCRVAQKLKFGKKLKLSRGEDESGGRESESLLADTFEAYLGALYLEQGLDACRDFLKTQLFPEIESIVRTKAYRDEKSLLQEIAQEKVNDTPVYKILEEYGPDHDKIFKVGVFIKNKKEGEGGGSSKQKAEVEAAKNALEKLDF